MLMSAACNTPAPPDASVDDSEAFSEAVQVKLEADEPDRPEENTSAPNSFSESGQEEGAGTETVLSGEESGVSFFKPEVNAGSAEMNAQNNETASRFAGEKSDGMIAVTLTIGTETFAALFYDNEASRALIEQMPLTISMADLNRNEKYYNFPDHLHSAAAESPSIIRAGEIMCWSGNCLVLFYDTFSNSYGGYVRMGYIEDTGGLADAVGSGSVTVTFTVASSKE